METPQGTPFSPVEFQHVLKQIRDGKCRMDDCTLFCIAEQVEANRLAIEELRRQTQRAAWSDPRVSGHGY